ncbi:MAG: hypothetical protein II857_11185 [Selenomonadaceae bacterium]|nr:hypothetical protein [Selenomonadaceae bacterium]
MSLKKVFCGALAATMIFSASVFAAPEDSANAKLAKIETDTYGTEQSGAILDRISRLEKSYSGQNMMGNMNARIDAIYNVLYENETNPSILAKINALEWNIDHEVQKGGIDRRLEALENKILGKINDGTFNDRIRALAKASYGEEILPITLTPIPANTLIKVATTIPVGSKTLQEGDTIPIEVVEDVFVDGNLVFARGLPGEGVVVNVHRAKNIFSNGKIETDFNALKAIDGQDVNTYAGVEAIDAMTAESMARGLSLLGQTFSGKNKDIAEVLVRGKNIDLPTGVELYIQIKTPITVYGVNVNGTARPTQVVNPAPTIEQPTEQPVEQPTEQSPTQGLSDDEMTAKPPASEPVIVQVDPEPPASAQEPRPEEGKTLDGKDGEIVEIFDEE